VPATRVFTFKQLADPESLLRVHIGARKLPQTDVSKCILAAPRLVPGPVLVTGDHKQPEPQAGSVFERTNPDFQAVRRRDPENAINPAGFDSHDLAQAFGQKPRE
jgi:hypothetical protein